MENNSKFKIAVVGIGGVGGYIGGKLAVYFEDSPDVEIVLVARGENEKVIRANGLKLVTTQGEQIVRPKLVSTVEIGEPDLLLLCTKEYDLEKTVYPLTFQVGKRTVILPLLNGVDSPDRIAKMLPDIEIWRGCIYIVSKLSAPGVIEETGGICLIYFGNGKVKDEKAELVESIFRQAGVDARWAEDIDAKVWEKFVFISSLAGATSYLNTNTHGVLDDERGEKLLNELYGEIKLIAAAKKIDISEREVRQKLDNLKKLPPEATTSMQRDFSLGRQAELQSLVGYVIEQAKELNVPTPTYDKIYEELAKSGPVFRATKDQIMEAQKMLKEKSMYSGEQTGKLDDATRDGLKKFQTTSGIKVTGTLNKETLEKMGIVLTDKQKEM